MNSFQRTLCQSYGGGDYAHILDKPELWESEARKVGDTLFLFLMIELSDDGDAKMDHQTAIGRMGVAVRDIGTVIEAIEAANGGAPGFGIK